MHAALQAQLVEATHTQLERARPLLLAQGRVAPALRISFGLRGRAAGQLRIDPQGRPEIRYNLGMAALQPEAFVDETVPHEVAHLVTWLLYGHRVRPHGPEWRSVMQSLGITSPRRCHDFREPEQPARRQRRWSYRCGCRIHQLSTTRHKRVQQGTRYHCSICNGLLQLVKDNTP